MRNNPSRDDDMAQCSGRRYLERAKTFNGKLKPYSRLLVSPQDAQDVSVVVRFCVRHGLSPSVRAGGYGIAGWCVAGDVIIDLSNIKDIDVEPPLEVEDGTQDWTPMRDMPPPGSKGKARAQGNSIRVIATAPPQPPAEPSERPDLRTAPSTGKRRREDRSPSADPEDITSIMGTGHYENASHAVNSFLRGPPLPLTPGETPRQPPTHQPPAQRPRLYSPEPESAIEADPPQFAQAFSGASAQDRAGPATAAAAPPAMEEATRQISSGSTDSSGSGSGFSASSVSTSDTSTAMSPAPQDGDGGGEADKDEGSATPSTADPFAYLSGGSSVSAVPVSSSGAGVSMGVGVSAIPSFLLQPPNIGAAGSSSGVTAWNPVMGLGVGGVIGSSPFSMPPMSGLATASVPPVMSGQPSLVSPQDGMGASNAFAQALQAVQAASGHLGTMPHARPLHPHAYVTFGAGMNQKDVDIHTADNRLDGVDPVTGEARSAAVPYHIPM